MIQLLQKINRYQNVLTYHLHTHLNRIRAAGLFSGNKKETCGAKKKQKPVRVVKFNLFSAIDRARNYPTNTRKAYKSMAKPTQICTKSARLRATLLNA